AADAREVGRRRQAFAEDLDDGRQRAFAGRASGAERHREEGRRELRELAARGAPFQDALGRARREERDREQPLRLGHRRRGWSIRTTTSSGSAPTAPTR